MLTCAANCEVAEFRDFQPFDDEQDSEVVQWPYLRFGGRGVDFSGADFSGVDLSGS